MNRRFLFVSIEILLLFATSNGQAPPAQKAPQHTTPPHAFWNPVLEKDLGITPQLFHDMGLGMLTQEQEVNLFMWVEQREQQAKDSVPTTSFTCGRTGESFLEAKPESYEKVRVYVNASGSADEIISGIRQRLRAMNGTEVVYNSEEADLTVHIIAMFTREKRAGYQLGSATSVVVTRPCVWKLGTYQNDYDTIQDQFVQVGSEVPALVDAIVSAIDTDSLEPQRKSNAGYKKFLQERIKK